MIRINQIKIPVQKDETSALKKKIQKTLRTNHPYTYQIVRKSLDARDKGNLLHIYTVDVEFERSQDIPRNIIDNKNIMLTKDEKYTFPHRCRDDCNEKTDVSIYRPVIIGAGPAGYFAALQLACAGYRPIVYERGKCVEERTRDVEGFWQGETPICANSNVSFGEGGAGTFSDGKLNTGIKDKYGRIQAVIDDFIRFGASEEIGYLNKPQIGTDVLKHVMKEMREEIRSFGGEIHFSHQLTAISHRSDTCLSLTIKDLQNEQTIVVETSACILAIGHSARDTFAMLQAAGVTMEAKSFAMGLRIEHSQAMVNASQYGTSGQAKLLPAADYKMTYRSTKGRSVYSFCMCPGGFVIPAATGPEQLVVNGMSPSNRGTAWSNSGMVVETHPEDVAQFVKEHQSVIEQQEMKAQENASLFTPHSSLQMMYFQEIVEKQCWQQGNMKQTAPAQRMADFVNNRLSYDLPKSSYAPGLISSPLHFWMPSFVSKRLQEGFKTFGKNAHGFLTNEATLIAMETRTSSPVRIVRDRETLQHVRIQGLFPCGEGAGYAGGIVSAGVDGERCAEMCAEYLKQQ